jgi:predicted permease
LRRARVFAVAVAAAVLVAVVAATLSILPSLRADAVSAMPSAARVVEPSGGGLRRGLVVAEIAVALTLLVGAGLTLRSFARLRDADVGFSPEGLVAMQVDVPAGTHTPERLAALVRDLERQVETLAGVIDGYIWSPQVPGQSTWYTSVRPQDRPGLRDDQLPLVRFHYVGPGALEGIGLRFIAGRDIGGQDTADGAGAVVLSESAARVLWPDDEALGKRLRRHNREGWLTVVGVTEDAKHSGRQGPGSEDNIDVYFSFLQEPQDDIIVLARTAGEPSRVVEAARRAVQETAPGAPVFDAATLDDQMADQEAIPRFTATLAAAFAGTAALLASIGLYGLLAYAVCLRTREIGLRMALGARPGRILRDVLQQGLRLVLIGLALGGGGALIVSRWMAVLLFEVTPADPLAFAGATLLLLVVAVFASLLPARRALRVEPQAALRAG